MPIAETSNIEEVTVQPSGGLVSAMDQAPLASDEAIEEVIVTASRQASAPANRAMLKVTAYELEAMGTTPSVDQVTAPECTESMHLPAEADYIGQPETATHRFRTGDRIFRATCTDGNWQVEEEAQEAPDPH